MSRGEGLSVQGDSVTETPPPGTVEERAVRILLEYILVCFFWKKISYLLFFSNIQNEIPV